MYPLKNSGNDSVIEVAHALFLEVRNVDKKRKGYISVCVLGQGVYDLQMILITGY